MVIEVRDISKSFRVEKETFTALDRVSCEFRSGRQERVGKDNVTEIDPGACENRFRKDPV